MDVSGDADDLHTIVELSLPDGRTPWGSGCAGPAIEPGHRVNVCTGSSDDAPAICIARVTADVRAVVITLSDGTREDLVLYGDPDRLGARVAVLVHSRELDIHRVDLIGRDGSALADQT